MIITIILEDYKFNPNYFFMKRIVFFCVLWALSMNAFAQAEPNYLKDSKRHYLECGDVVEKNSIVNIDTLVVSCSNVLLLQDNAILNVKTVVFELGANATLDDEIVRFVYGDVSWDATHDPNAATVQIQRVDMDGYAYTDERYATDKDPVVNFLTCKPSGAFFDPNVQHTFTSQCHDEIGDDEFVVDATTEMGLDCIIWSMTGQEMYRGKFSGIFGGSCGVKCLQEQFWNKVLLIEFALPDGQRIRTKRIYVR